MELSPAPKKPFRRRKGTTLPPRPFEDFKSDDRLVEHKDSGGTYWQCMDPKAQDVELFWSKNENLIIRQEGQQFAEGVDLITMTVGQAYDVMRAIARALETTK